ncbi:MAG: LysR family transcriptional regulator [Lachnospiraceae bacterium]
MDINMEYFKIFYYVAKCGSITAAARQLHISQPAVSQAIKSFEDSLGGTVFVRNAKGVTLTEEGKSLYYHVAKGYEQMENGVRQYSALQNLAGGGIRIGASDMTLRFFILPYLEKFCEEYPQIKVSVTNAPTPRTLKNLEQGTIDFGVVSTPISPMNHMVVKPVRQVQDCFVVGEKYRELALEKHSYRILKKYPVICLEGETSSKAYVDAFLQKQGIVLKPEFELATSDMLVTFAKRGFGIASVVRDFAREGIEDGQLYELAFHEKIKPRQFAICYDDRLAMSFAARTLLEMMTENC